MNQLKPLASVGVTANQYWQLINAMLFNLKTIGYVFVVFFSIALISVFLIIIFPSFYMLGIGLAFLACWILALVGIMALPMGMLMLLSNRQLFIMADIRNKLFVIACIFCLLASVLIVTSDFFIKNEALSLGVVIYVFLSCTLYFGLATYVCSKRFELLFITPLVMVVWVKLSFEVLVAQQLIVLLSMILLSWILFYRWWITFSPKRERVKSILVEIDRRKMQENLYMDKWQYFLSHHVKTPIGSLLLGYGDSPSAYIKSLAVVYLAALIFSYLVCKGFVDWQFTDSAFTATIIAFAYAFLISVIGLPAKSMLINLRRGWLAFAGCRLDFFHYIERQFFKGLSVLVAFNLALITLLVLMSNHVHYFLYCLGALLGFSVLTILMFYADIYFYMRGRIVLGEIDLFKTVVNIICFVPLVCYLVFKYQTFNIFELKDVLAIGVVLLVLGFLKMVRSQAISKWQKSDF